MVGLGQMGAEHDQFSGHAVRTEPYSGENRR
jgi:hypothetical protein